MTFNGALPATFTTWACACGFQSHAEEHLFAHQLAAVCAPMMAQRAACLPPAMPTSLSQGDGVGEDDGA